MRARRCQGCAAPLPDGAPGAVLRCPFCGLVHDAAGAGTPEVPVPAVTIDRRGGGMPRWALVFIGLIVASAVVPTVAGLVIGWRAIDSSSERLRSLAAVPTPPAPVALTPDRLKGVPRGYHALEVTPPTGGYGSLDPVGALPWALAIAQAWEADARLERIDVSRLRPDGTVNVQDDGDASLTYRFRSPSKVEALRAQARLQAGAEEGVGLWVRVKEGKPQVYADFSRAGGGRDEGPAPHPSALSLPDLFARPGVRAMRADVPFFNAYMIHLADEGWVWYLSTLANESMPRVRARDGAVWPYRRSK